VIIARYGATWVSSYTFGTYQAADNWQAQLLPVTQQVGGAGGVFDFFGDEQYPPAPLSVTKAFTVRGSDYNDVDDEIDAARAWTLGYPSSYEPKLFAHNRGDGATAATRIYTPAKCIAFKANEMTGKYLTQRVEIKFYCPDGLWYGETEQLYDHTFSSGANTFTLTNAGNYPALVNVWITPYTTNMTSCKVENLTYGGGANPEWTFTGTVLPSVTLRVNACTYHCANGFVEAYADLTLGTGQIPWLWLWPGNNSIRVTANPTSYRVYAYWNDTYLK